MALLNLGFRLFFTLAGCFAVVSIGLWGAVYAGLMTLPLTRVNIFHWHSHEMIYGYSLAVIAGFLLTAVRNWTGIQTLKGWPLLVLAGFWLLARLCFVMDWMLAAALTDMLFMLGLIVALASPLLQARQWKQMAILGKLALLTMMHLLFYLGALGYLENGQYLGIYGGFYIVVSLILMMGRRLFPFFVKAATGRMLPNNDWLDRASLLLFLVFFVAELAVLSPWVAAYLALLLFVVNAWRLLLWHCREIWRTPMLWVLYFSLWSICLGFLLFFLTLYLPVSKYIALHAMAYGGIGLITLGMMARVSLGHTGRNLRQYPGLVSWGFAVLLLGTLLRVLMPILWPAQYLWWVSLSQGLWVLAFVIFLAVYVPMLVRPRIDGKPG